MHFSFIKLSVKNIFFHVDLCVRLFGYLICFILRGSWKWMRMLGSLILYTAILFPGWIFMMRYWFCSSRLIRNIEYGEGFRKRNIMDIYLPLHCESALKAPVIIFVSGGAWIIGYKVWGAFIGRGLSLLGFLVVVPDYRNFPQGDITDMMTDVRNCILWTIQNIDDERYRGDASHIVLAGQSAGSHIAMCVLVSEFSGAHLRNSTAALSSYETEGLSAGELELKSSAARVPTILNHVKMFVGVSGPYNLPALEMHFHSRGLDSSLLHMIFDNDLAFYSPTLTLEAIMSHMQRSSNSAPSPSVVDKGASPSGDGDWLGIGVGVSSLRHLPQCRLWECSSRPGTPLAKFPAVSLFHGCADATVPCVESERLLDVLRKGGAAVRLALYKRWTHTDPIIECPLLGDQILFRDIYAAIRSCKAMQNCSFGPLRMQDKEGLEKADLIHNEQAIVPEFVVAWARAVNPF